MRGVHLAVDRAVIAIPALPLRGEMGERDFGRVAAAAEHRFAEEHRADMYAIQAARQFAIHPYFHRVGMALPMQRAIRRDHLFQNPGAAAFAIARRGAGAHHLRENGVGADFVGVPAQGLAQRLGKAKLGGEQNHARVGAPPQNRITGAEPGKDAAPVGRQQPFRRQVAAGGEQAVGLVQCVFDRRERHGGRGYWARHSVSSRNVVVRCRGRFEDDRKFRALPGKTLHPRAAMVFFRHHAH